MQISGKLYKKHFYRIMATSNISVFSAEVALNKQAKKKVI